MPAAHELQTPSPWVVRWAHLVPPGAAVLDVACGRGRHARYFAARGCRVLAVDRDAAALAAIATVSGITPREVDLESGAWPFQAGSFGAVVAANYLYRPLLGPIIALLERGGVLIYETFMQGNERFGKPSNPDFLLRPGELLEAVRGRLEVVAFEQGETREPQPAVIQRLCAIRGPVETVTRLQSAPQSAEIR